MMNKCKYTELIKRMVRVRITLVVMLSLCLIINAQKIVKLPFGDMEKWQVREIKESGIIGGNIKYVYEINEGDTLEGNEPYVNISSAWATSSIMANIVGIYKSSTTVFPCSREDGGVAAEMVTRLESVKVLGLVNVSALATGTIFLGSMIEPIRTIKNPMSTMCHNVEFIYEPTTIIFDYKFINGNEGKRVMDSSLKSRDLEGKNAAEVVLLIQHRWEDESGKIYAKRVATGYERYYDDQKDWKNCERVEIRYGDIRQRPDFEDYMDLVVEDPYYTLNSKGEMVPIHEIDWANSNEKPTHIIFKFSSGYGGAYIGAPGSKLWVDNVSLEL